DKPATTVALERGGGGGAHRGSVKRKAADETPSADSEVLTKARPPLCLPSSPDLVKPQSLLIPSLLPKGMLRNTTENATTNTESRPLPVSRPLLPPPPLSLPEVPFGGAMPFSMGLDLGFDIAHNAFRQNPQSDAGMSSSIMEIASFLERDIDVFTPMSAAWTPRLAAATPSTTSSLPPTSAALNPKSPASKQRELIDDI
ncbi:hypothetical protein GGI21_006251, partial [Coemansia aciculifera]